MDYDKTYEGFINQFPEYAENTRLKKAKVCAVCGEDYYGYGNDAFPIVDGCCCNRCNATYVVPARMAIGSGKLDPVIEDLMNPDCDKYGLISDTMDKDGISYRFILAYNKSEFPVLMLSPNTHNFFYKDIKRDHFGKFLSRDCSETGFGVLLIENKEIGTLNNNEVFYRTLLPRTENCPFKQAA